MSFDGESSHSRVGVKFTCWNFAMSFDGESCLGLV